MWLSDVCLSVAYIGPKSRTERPRKTKFGTEVDHVTRDSDTTFKVKRSRSPCRGRGILWRPPAQLVRIRLKTIRQRQRQTARETDGQAEMMKQETQLSLTNRATRLCNMQRRG